MTSPKYQVGDVVYLRESAALGHLEAVTVSGVQSHGSGWLYSIAAGRSLTPAQTHGDRISFTRGARLLLSEDEFVSMCEALVLAEENALAQYERVRDQRRAQCPDVEETTS